MEVIVVFKTLPFYNCFSKLLFSTDLVFHCHETAKLCYGKVKCNCKIRHFHQDNEIRRI